MVKLSPDRIRNSGVAGGEPVERLGAKPFMGLWLVGCGRVLIEGCVSYGGVPYQVSGAVRWRVTRFHRGFGIPGYTC